MGNSQFDPSRVRLKKRIASMPLHRISCCEPPLTNTSSIMNKRPSQSLVAELKPFVAPFRFDGSSAFHLKSQKTPERGGLDKGQGEEIIEANHKRLSDFQEKLYAQNSWSLLLIFQDMTPPEKTAPSRASSRASTRRAARSIPSSSRQRLSSIMISSGAT